LPDQKLEQPSSLITPPPPKAGSPQKPVPGFLQTLILIAAYFISQFLIIMVFYWAFGAEAVEQGAWRELFSIAIFSLPFLIVIALAYLLAGKQETDFLPFRWRPKGQWLWLVLAFIPLTFLVFSLGGLLYQLLPPSPEWEEYFSDLVDFKNLYLRLFIIGVLPGVLEEVLFRGVIYSGYRRRYGFWWAALLSAILFGAVHLNPWQFLSAAVLGVFFAFLVEETESLLLPMLMHFIYNSSIVLIGHFQDPESPEIEGLASDSEILMTLMVFILIWSAALVGVLYLYLRSKDRLPLSNPQNNQAEDVGDISSETPEGKISDQNP
jgi:membrane protease YdiL (CAAX protease family)